MKPHTRIYRLYIWRVHGGRRVRGRCIGAFLYYKDLLAYALQLTVAAHYPKSRWMDLYDWNQS